MKFDPCPLPKRLKRFAQNLEVLSIFIFQTFLWPKIGIYLFSELMRRNEISRIKNKLIFQGIFYAFFHTLKIFCHALVYYVAKKIHFGSNLVLTFSSNSFFFLKTSITTVHKFFTVDSSNRTPETLIRAVFLTRKCHFCGTWSIWKKSFNCGSEFEASWQFLRLIF